MTDIGVAKKQSDIERHIKEQKHRREHTGITLYIYNQHSEGARNTQWGKDRLFKKMVLGKLQTHNQRTALQFHLTPSTKQNWTPNGL